MAISRYQDYFPSLPAGIQEDIYARIGELIEEEKAYCDKGNYKHMAQILTSIAMYEVLQRRGKSEEEAYRIVSEEMWKFLDPSGMQKLATRSIFLPLMKKIVPFGFKKGSGTGWRYTWHEDDPKNEFHFECNECLYVFMKISLQSFGPDAGFGYAFPESHGNEARFNIVKCPYYETCLQYGCPEITRAFCDGDDAGYGNLHPKLIWGRTRTIGRGDDCCDFLLAYREN